MRSLIAGAEQLRRQDDRASLVTLAEARDDAARALGAYAASGEPGDLVAARAREARAARLARALGAPGCGGARPAR